MASKKENDNEEEGATEEKVAKPKSNLVMLIVIIFVVVLIQVVLAFVVVKITAPKEETESTEQAAAGHGEKKPGKHGEAAKEGESGKHGEAGKEGEAPAEGGEVPAHEVFTKKPIEVIVNIAGTDATRFLKVKVQLALDAELPENKGYDAAFPYDVQAQNKINEYLSALPIEEVTQPNAQQNIRGDLLRAINDLIPEGKGQISNVYINQYIIQ